MMIVNDVKTCVYSLCYNRASFNGHDCRFWSGHGTTKSQMIQMVVAVTATIDQQSSCEAKFLLFD